MSVPATVCSLFTHLNMPMTVCSAPTMCKEWEGENMHKPGAPRAKGETRPCSDQVCAPEPHRLAPARTQHSSCPAESRLLVETCRQPPAFSHPFYLRKPCGDPPPRTAVTQLFSGPGVTGLGMGCIHRAPSFWNMAAPAELRSNQAK